MSKYSIRDTPYGIHIQGTVPAYVLLQQLQKGASEGYTKTFMSSEGMFITNDTLWGLLKEAYGIMDEEV